MSGPEFDVVIVGGGIAGAALARALSAGDLRLALVEARPVATAGIGDLGDAGAAADFDSRVSAITPASQSFLADIGAWDAIARARLCPYQRMDVWDADGTGRIEFTASEVDATCLGHIIENRLLTAALLQDLDARPGLTLFSPARLETMAREDQAVSLTLDDGRELTTALLVAADGALSPVRELAEFRTREWDYGHQALVATLETERDHGATAYQRFLSTGPLAFLPLPGVDDRHFCSIVWSAEPALAEHLLAMDDGEFAVAASEAIEGRLGAVLDCSPRTAFPLRQRHAVDYVKPGLALVGDAAHTIHPLAGQGINLGLADVSVLAEEVLAAHGRGAAIGELAVLGRYQRRRKGENLAMMAAMDGFKRLFGERRLPVRWLRNQGMQWVGRSGALKQQLMRHAMGVR